MGAIQDPQRSLSESIGEEIDDHLATLWDIWTASAVDAPDAEAVVSMWQAESSAWEITPLTTALTEKTSYLRWTYRDLYHRSSVLASNLESSGVKTGDRLAAFLWNSAEYALFAWAAAKLGAVFCPLDPRVISADGTELLAATNPVVVVVQDEVGASALQVPPGFSGTKIQCSGPLAQDYTQLSSYMSPIAIPDSPIVPPSSPVSHSDLALIVFTSGSTGSPKGCMHLHSQILAETHQFDANLDSEHVDRWLVHLPCSHIFAINHCTRAWRLEDCVVFPSKAFDIQATLNGLLVEQGTIMSATPTLIKALLGHPAYPGKEKLDLRLVAIGGTVITPGDIKLAKQGLGARDAVQAYGMSEGAPFVSWSRQDPMLKEQEGYHKGVGKVLPGVKVRICKPNSREVLPRGEAGELYVGGVGLISGYLGGVQKESFYEDDDGTRWMVTGDQGIMDEDGVIYIVGRYKDIIIRGGENISPVKMEVAIAELGVTGQVVAATDDLAGQVPVACVAKLPGGVGKKEVMHKCRDLGPMYALDGVYTLEELGLESFPLTSIGKVKKEVLRQLVAKLRAGRQTPNPVSAPAPVPVPKSTPKLASEKAPEDLTTNGHSHSNDCANGHTEINAHGHAQVSPKGKGNGHIGGPMESNGDGHANSFAASPLVDRISDIWENLIGERPAPDDSISTFADSITLLRFCDRVQTFLGQRIYLQDFAEHDTIEKQALLIDKRSAKKGQENGFGSLQTVDLGEAKLNDLKLNETSFVAPASSSNYNLPASYLRHGRLSLTVQEALLPSSAVAAATSIGFSPSDIQDIIRIKDSFHGFASGARPQAYHNRTVFRVWNTPLSQLRAGICAALATRDLMRAILGRLPDGSPFHVVLSASEKYFEKAVSYLELHDEDGLGKLVNDGSDEGHTSLFMARFQIVEVRSSGDLYLLATYSHSVLDALSHTSWHLDLNRYIRIPETQVPPLAPFKLFSDLYHQFQGSLSGQINVEWNVKRLRGISRFADKALWPVPRTEGWMITSEDAEGSPRQVMREKIWEEDGGWVPNKEAFTFPKYSRIVALQGMQKVLTDIGITAPVLFKAAIAILNTQITRSPYAIFNSWHASRQWPFIPPWLASTLPPPMSIAGPTTEWAVELIEVIRGSDETIAAFLARMQREDEDLQAYVQAPWYQILEKLGEDEAAIVIEASKRQSFVWDVSMGMTQGFNTGVADADKTLEVVQRNDWPDCGFFWNAFMLDASNLFFIASWDTAQMSAVEVEGHCEMLAKVLRKLVHHGNWGKRVDEVFSV